MSHSALVKVPGHENYVFADTFFDKCNRKYNTRTKNLVPMSENLAPNFFWSFLNSATSITNYARAPDGTNTSNLIQDPSVGSVSFIKNTITIEDDVEDYTFSVFLRNGTGVSSQFLIGFSGGTSKNGTFEFDWGNNVLANVSGNFTGSGYEYICDGWYRVWASIQNNGLGNTSINVEMYPSPDTNEGDAEMWGVQVEKAATTPGHYIKTSGGARIDGCFPKGENLLKQSESFDHANWGKTNCTVTVDNVSSPDNEDNADTVVRTAIGDHLILQDYTTTAHANKPYSIGVWLKKGNYADTVYVGLEDGAGAAIASLTPTLTDQWQLITVSGTFGSSPAADIRFILNPTDNTGSAGDTFHVWGASLAEGLVYKAYQKTIVTNIEDGRGALDNALKCYETYETCQVRSDYGSICTQVRLCQSGAAIPQWKGIAQGPIMYPFIEMTKNNPTFTSTKIIPTQGLSQRGACTTRFMDGLHHDRGLDPYFSERTHDTTQGTFFGKLLSRNRHYHERRYDVYTGYLEDGELDIANFEKRAYVMDQFTGPNLKGNVVLKARDVLFVADASRKIPAANTGELIADQLAADLVFDIAINLGAQYPRIGTAKIGSELVTYTNFGHNYLTKSEEFDHADWTTAGLTSVASSTAEINPFGVSLSYLLTENSASSTHIIFQDGTGAIFGQAYGIAVYVKKHASGSGYIGISLESSAIAFFDIANGDLITAEDTDDYINAKIEDVGNGWYRCSMISPSALGADATFNILPTTSALLTTYTGTGNAQFYMWAASYTDSATLGNYYKTTTTQFIANDRMIVASTAERGVFNTVAEDHSIGDSVQQCLVYNENFVDILYNVLVVQAGVSPIYVPYDPTGVVEKLWNAEKTEWLSAHTFFGIIPEPTQVNKIVKDLTIAAMCDIWADEIDDLIMLKAIVPNRLNAPTMKLDEAASIIKDSVRLVRKEDMRRSRVIVVYDMINHVEGGDPENFNKIFIQADPITEEFYGSPSIEKIRSPWLSGENTGQAAQLAGRTLARFIDAPKEITFKIHAKDESLKVGDLVDISVPGIQDFFGATEDVTFQIIEKRELEPSEIYEVTGLESRFTGGYGFIGPNTLGEYSAESAGNQRKYAFVCYNTKQFLDGESAYKII